jgi:AraC-like DNA-binding protein
MHDQTDKLNKKYKMTFMSGEEIKVEKKLFKKLIIAQKFMQDHFLDTPTNAVIARHCGLSSFHFSRTYKMVFAETPLVTITRFKILLARTLICRSRLDVWEIAAILNYSDIFTFSKAFKKHLGQTPTEYRLSHSNAIPVKRLANAAINKENH